MKSYTEQEVEEMVRDAVERTEKSFGGTFKRLKSENEELAAEYETLTADREETVNRYEERIAALESERDTGQNRISELAVRGELARQLAKGEPLPERFIDPGAIEYSDDPEVLGANVAAAVENGRREFGGMLRELGIDPAAPGTVNPTNPPSRDPRTSRDLSRSGARDALRDMARRGLLR